MKTQDSIFKDSPLVDYEHTIESWPGVEEVRWHWPHRFEPITVPWPTPFEFLHHDYLDYSI